MTDYTKTDIGAGYNSTNPMFGDFTSNADAAVTGYITIVDQTGTARKLATIA